MIKYVDDNGKEKILPEKIVILKCPDSWLIEPGDYIEFIHTYYLHMRISSFEIKVLKGYHKNKIFDLLFSHLSKIEYVSIEKFEKLKAFV